MKLSHTITCAVTLSVACACLPSAAAVDGEDEGAANAAAADPALTEEIAFIEALVEANMPDFAESVIAAAKKKWPNAGPKLRVLELQGDLRLGKFDAVQKVVDSLKGKKGQESEYWALRLSMADAYYARSMMKECRGIYGEFFKAVTKPGADIIDFYVESGFRWAQICVREKAYDEAVRMYGRLLANLSDSSETWCMVAMEDVELLLRLAEEIPADPKDKQAKKRNDYIAQAEALVKRLLWKNELILVFGKAISMKAHIEMLRGNPAKAQALVNEYMPQLSEIHNSLVEQDPQGKLGYVRASPMPECRYLLAKMLWDRVQAEAKKPKADENLIKDSLFGARGKNGKRNGLGAYNHAINVCAKYQESSWAADAGELTEKIEKFVKERYNKEIKSNITAAQINNLRKRKYQDAFELYRGQDYAKAVEAYKKILANLEAETEDSASARGVLADCYVNLRQNAKKGSPEQADFAKLATEAEDFVSTQFKGKSEELVRLAGNETLRLAAKEKDLGNLARAQQLYDAFFENYPDHYNAAQMSYTLATQAYTSEDWGTAIRFYEQLVKRYPKSPHAVDALQYLATCNEKVGNVAEQEKWLREFIKATNKVSARTTAQLNLALIQQKQAFAAFDAADATNDVAVAETMRKKAYGSVVGSIKDFRSVAADLAKTLEAEGKTLDEKVREQYVLRREQAIILEGASWQRLMRHVEEKNLPKIRAMAIKAFEKYLEVYPKGKYAPQTLVKIGTIYTAESKRAADAKDEQLSAECMKKSQEAFARLQRDFPNSEDAKNSVPRLAKTLIEMGLNSEGVAEYKKMLETPGGKYTAGQFLMAGDALLEAKSWMVASDAYAKVAELAGQMTNSIAYLAPALIGQAKAAYGAKSYAEARQKLDDFIEKYGKSALVIDAYEMLVEVASAEGIRQKDDSLRMNAFNTAVRALKKLRAYRKTQLEQDELDIRSGEVLLRKIQAESAMNLQEAMKETRGRAVVNFQAFLMAHEPTEEHPAKEMSAKQLENLERCYSYLLPLMAAHGSDKAEILAYGEKYRQLFPNGKHKQDVETVLKPLEGN